MPKRVFLHVGLPKSGTTYVQAVLAENKQQLMDGAGLLYPGATWADQVRAVRDVRAMPVPKSERRKVRGAWRALAEEIHAWPGDAIVSMEWLCRADPEQISRIVQSLEPAEVQVIFTVRDLGRTIPAAWQESIQNRHEWSWREFLGGVTSDEPSLTRPGRRFWLLHDVARLLACWSQVIPPERMHLITIPAAGNKPTVLWERLCRVLDVDSSGYVTEGVTDNVSLGLESVELLRRLIPLARRGGVSKTVHGRVLAQGLAKRGLAGRGPRESRLALPADLHDWVRRRSDEEIDGVSASQVHVVGDLDELRPRLQEGSGCQPEDIDADAMLEVALDAMVILVQQRQAAMKRAAGNTAGVLARRDAQVRRLTRQNARLRRRNAEVRLRLARLRARPFRSALEGYGRRHPTVRAVSNKWGRRTKRREPRV